MSPVRLSVATEAYDRVLPLRDGRVAIEGCDATFLTLQHEELFLRAFHGHEFDVCELSMSSYLTSLSLGGSEYIAVPVFPSRLFRHSAIYVNAASGIVGPEDLVGKRVGVPEYQVTAALWVRGMLDDDYGVGPADFTWFRGGLEHPGRKEKLPLALPAGVEVIDIDSDQTLGLMLANGALDALISPRAPAAFGTNGSDVRRLFPDYRTVEEDYYKRTRLFPIMHVIGIRRSLVAEHPWLSKAVFNAFDRAKTLAIRAFSDVSALRVTLPWFAAELDRTRALMGQDFWPYGIEPNRHVIEKMLDYAYRHGTTDRRIAIAELFAPMKRHDATRTG